MKLQFKNQAFQEAATAAVCDVFEGQPYHDPNVYTVDPGKVVASSQLSGKSEGTDPSENLRGTKSEGTGPSCVTRLGGDRPLGRRGDLA